MLCCEHEEKLSDFGIGWSSNSFIFIGNWHYVHEIWILFLLNYWRSISQRNC